MVISLGAPDIIQMGLVLSKRTQILQKLWTQLKEECETIGIFHW